VAPAPRTPGAPDHHAALVLPPTAEADIRALADSFDIKPKLPCVLFLGPVEGAGLRPFERRPEPTVLTSWACLRLLPEDEGGPYPDQLDVIYQTVYGRGALLPGDERAVFFDRGYRWLRARLKLTNLAWLLLTGALGPEASRAILEVCALIEEAGA